MKRFQVPTKIAFNPPSIQSTSVSSIGMVITPSSLNSFRLFANLSDYVDVTFANASAVGYNVVSGIQCVDLYNCFCIVPYSVSKTS
jgi:hypothetical protein